MKLVKHIPNLFTLGNLACGTLAIVNIFNDEPKTAVYLVLLSAVLDFFDGFLARLLKGKWRVWKTIGFNGRFGYFWHSTFLLVVFIVL
jgi:CDP-diacylglycerol---serine O-phosphatidyltransferase